MGNNYLDESLIREETDIDVVTKLLSEGWKLKNAHRNKGNELTFVLVKPEWFKNEEIEKKGWEIHSPFNE
jgi:hypothetical protein